MCIRDRAGLHKHKWSWTVKYAPDHFGKDKLKSRSPDWMDRWINVGQLDHLAEKLRLTGDKPTIDLTALGYAKLLGGGVVRGSYRVRVNLYTESAKEKIEAAGGELVAG